MSTWARAETISSSEPQNGKLESYLSFLIHKKAQRQSICIERSEGHNKGPTTEQNIATSWNGYTVVQEKHQRPERRGPLAKPPDSRAGLVAMDGAHWIRALLWPHSNPQKLPVSISTCWPGCGPTPRPRGCSLLRRVLEGQGGEAGRQGAG